MFMEACLRMGSVEGHFNVSLTVMGEVTKTAPINHNFWRERRPETESNRGPSAYPPNALPLGPTGSRGGVGGGG